MPTVKAVTITPEAHAVIRANARGHFSDTATRLPDSMLEVLMTEDTAEGLERCALPGETPSETIIRVGTLARTGGKPN